MKMVWKADGTPEALEHAAPPEKPESPFILWAGILGASTGSVFFNTYHDTHSLPSVAVGVLAGFLPPFMAATTIHAVKVTGETWVKVCVFLVTVAAMVVSAIGASQLLKPAYFSWGSYLFPFVLDSADLLLLYAIMEHYEKASAFKKWLKAQAGAPAGTVIPAPGTGATAPAPVQAPAPAPAVQPTPPLPAPAPVQRPNRPAPATGTGSGAPAPKRAGTAKPATAAVPADAELRMKIAKEMRARDRPAIEDTQQKIARLQEFAAEFRTRTGGARMNADEASIALRTHKSKIAALRACISEPGEPSAAGEQERGEETG